MNKFIDYNNKCDKYFINNDKITPFDDQINYSFESEISGITFVEKYHNNSLILDESSSDEFIDNENYSLSNLYYK